jgi:hypothetical protein
MKRSLVLILALGLLGGAAASRAAAEASKIATSMGDLRWGMSESDVTTFVQRKLGERYNAEIAKTHDAGKQAKLRADMKRAQSDVEHSLTNFEGASSRWDKSPIAGEFAHDNSESMLVAKDDSTQNYYFFVSGRLWKWVKVLDKGGDFKKFSQSLEAKFGKGRVKKGELANGQGNTQWVEYLDRNSRLRASDSTSKRSGFALIFEEMSAVRELASTHGGTSKPSRVAGMSDDDDSEPKSVMAKSSNDSSDGQIAKASPKRSVFGNEHHDESDNEYQTRKQKVASEARDRAQRAQDRKEETKKGEALKQLDGLNDSDPLGGL